MRAAETIKSIWKIEDLRNRILTALLLAAIYRLGTYVVLPGIDPKVLTALQKQTRDGLLALLDMFSGGTFSNTSIFALRIMPYISTSIVMRLLIIAVPSFQKLQREDENDRRKVNQWTRYLTIAILLFQGPTYLVNLSVQLRTTGAALPGGIWFTISSTTILAAGSMPILWLGERITGRGVENGTSFIILVGTIARLPHSLFQEFVSEISEKTGGLAMFLSEMLSLLLIIADTILSIQGTRKVPVQYAKRIIGDKQYGGARQYIPLKVNVANIMSIIFAQVIMFIPISIVGFSGTGEWSGFWVTFMDNTGFWYSFVFVMLIILFTYFYTAITISPTQMSDDLKRDNGFIPGVKPGRNTKDYLDTIMDHITLSGVFLLTLVAIMPAFAGIAGVSMKFSQFFGSTSLLILIGVVLDTLQQIENHLLMRHYNGLLKSGRIKGRAGSVVAY